MQDRMHDEEAAGYDARQSAGSGIKACHVRYGQGECRYVRDDECSLAGGVGQGSQYRQHAPFMVRHGIEFVREKQGQSEVKGSALHEARTA